MSPPLPCPPPPTAPPHDDGVWAPPGRYTITAPEHPLFTATPIETTIGTDPVTLTMSVGIQQAVTSQIQQQIRARLDTCAAVPDLNPSLGQGISNCRFRYTPEANHPFIDNVNWTITSYPTIELRVDPAGPVTVHTTQPGHATVTYRWTRDILEPRDWSPANGAADITVAGDVELDNNTPRWTG